MQEKVLCKGHVDLVDHMGSDLTVCNAARVSFSKDTEWEIDEEAVARLRESGSSYHPEDVQKLGERDQKLIRYLAKHQHWTPFAHPQITLRIKAPVSIRTQMFKHKQGFVENEISRRYVSFKPEFYFPYGALAHMDATFASTSTVDDVLDMDVICERVGSSSVVLVYTLTREDQEVFRGVARYVNVDESGTPTPIPDALRTALAG